jgi:hypothetical protein
MAGHVGSADNELTQGTMEMHRNQLRCRPISRVPAHAQQTTLQVKTDTVIELMESVTGFLTGVFETFGTSLTGFIGTISGAWQFGSKRSTGA